MFFLFLVWLDDVGWFWKVCVLMWLDYKDELQQFCCCVSPFKSYVRDSSPQQLRIRFLTEREDYFSCIESEWEPNPPCCNVDMAKEDEVGVKPWNLHNWNWNADFGELFTPWLCPIFLLLTIFRGRRNQEAKMALKPKPAEEEPEKRRSKVKARCLGIWLIHVGGMLITKMRFPEENKTDSKLSVFQGSIFLGIGWVPSYFVRV